MAKMPQLELALRGAKREQSGQPKRSRLPITPHILMKLYQVWDQQAKEWDHIMLWAACCLGFFGFLRSAEFTAPERDDFDPEQHLNYTDIAVGSLDHPRSISVNIKQSKTDPFRLGVKIVLGRTGSCLCPVGAVLSYLMVRGPGEGPLFRFKDGRALTRPLLVRELQTALAQVGINPDLYAGHSFRIGAATTAVACGVSADIIKTLGRWRSDAYQLYIKLPREQLSNISKTLAAGRV